MMLLKKKFINGGVKISEIVTASEEIKIHMLLLYPEHQNLKDKEFINKILLSSTNNKNLILHNEKNLESHPNGFKKVFNRNLMPILLPSQQKVYEGKEQKLTVAVEE